jgi:hypothetical protein
MPDYKALTFTQRVLHPVQADFDFQHLAAVD